MLLPQATTMPLSTAIRQTPRDTTFYIMDENTDKIN
jgi:hypothetical protein